MNSKGNGRPIGPGAAVAAIGFVALVAEGCTLPAFGGYKGATTQAHSTHLLYSWMVIAALAVGAIVVMLLLWVLIRYRSTGPRAVVGAGGSRRVAGGERGAQLDAGLPGGGEGSGGEERIDEERRMPRQTQYHLPLEVVYTVIPVIIVLVVFFFTVGTENKVDAVVAHPYTTINVTAFQWGWNFDYPKLGIAVHGVTLQNPEMVVPVGEPVQIDLRSQDVVHGFYVRQFNFSRYAQPGVLNEFDLTVSRAGTYQGQCTQFCGLYHAQMLFRVKAVPVSGFGAWVHAEQSRGTTSVGAQPSPRVRIRSDVSTGGTG